MFDYDVLVIGSGFGGSTTALRLTEKGYSVGVIEAGKRWSAETLPKTNWNTRKFLWMPRLGMRGIQRINMLKDVMILSGAGVGGGSLVYANTLYRPLADFWTDDQWGDITDWEKELAPYYDQAERMLGVTKTPFETPADEVMRNVACELGVSETFESTPVGVYFGHPREEVEDPYFGGEGPTRTGCERCGGCMVGCRHNAKNTLDHNYLYLAERNGAKVHAERQVVDVVPLAGGGFRIDTERPGAWVSHRRKSFTAEQVVFSAGVLGTLKLLMGLKQTGRLTHVSDQLGETVRTNSEAIVGVTAKGVDVDYSQGVAITSSIHPDEQTHIEPARYPKGSNVMGLLATILVDGGGNIPRPLRFVATVLRHPVVFARSLSVRRWAERSMILLVMQSRDNSLRVKAKIRRGRVKLTSEPSHGEPNPTYIPVANLAARIAARDMDGEPGSALNEVLLDVPTTAHILGGCCIGSDERRGVIDPYQRVYGQPGLHVADGSAVSANLGVNPSLTITAQTERAMALWPNKGERDPRPPLGAEYEDLAAVLPRSPSVPVGAPAGLGW